MKKNDRQRKKDRKCKSVRWTGSDLWCHSFARVVEHIYFLGWPYLLYSVQSQILTLSLCPKSLALFNKTKASVVQWRVRHKRTVAVWNFKNFTRITSSRSKAGKPITKLGYVSKRVSQHKREFLFFLRFRRLSETQSIKMTYFTTAKEQERKYCKFN